MGRATTKSDLMADAVSQYGKMWGLIESIPEAERTSTFRFDDRDRCIRDVLIHLYEWHQLLLLWVSANQGGEKRPFLPEPYNWKTYPEMNVRFWEKHQGTPYEEAIRLLNESHQAVLDLVDSLDNDALFTKKHFPWTGTTSLGSYCVSATSSHYDWAIKKIKRHKASI